MKVAVVGTVGVPACYGGFESLVENLILNRSESIEYHVFCSSKTYNKKISSYKGARLIYLPCKANGISSIFYDILSLIYSIFIRPDVTLILGVSGCVFLPFYRLFSSSRVVTNIDGLEWRRAKWSKFARSFLKFSESFAVRFSHAIISDNQAITDYVKSEYGCNSFTIAYGGDHAFFPKQNLTKVSSIKLASNKYYFSLCRIEPENNVHLILDSFSKSGFPLKFVGNWSSSDYGKNLFQEFSSYSNIDMISPVYDVNILFELRSNCVGYVHGHSAGGTNPSLVEAMHFGKPIFAFDCDFNRFTTCNKAFFFSTPDELIDLLNDTTISDKDVSAQAMKQIAISNYTWAHIREQYESIFFDSQVRS